MAITLMVVKEKKVLFFKNHEDVEEDWQIRDVVWKGIDEDDEEFYVSGIVHEMQYKQLIEDKV